MRQKMVKEAVRKGQGAPADANRPVVIRGKGGVSFTLEQPPDLQAKAVKWAYTVRNRVRWATDPGIEREVQRDAREDLESLGIDEQKCKQLSDARLIEVSIPFRTEDEGWELRVLPWEFLLAAGTPKRVVVVRHLDCGNVPTPRVPQRAGIVASLPGKLQQSGYELDSEIALVKANLPFDVDVWRNPTLEELKASIAQKKPDLIHLAGVDLHEGHEILGQPEKRRDRFIDGFYLEADDNSAAPVESLALSDALTSSGKWRPVLVSVNVYNSAARIAALAVAKGASAAFGFQDEIDNVAAEAFFTTFYRKWRDSNWDLLASFEAALDGLAGTNKTGTGIVLWSALRLIDAPHPKAKAVVKTTVNAPAFDVTRDLITVVNPV